MNNDQRKLMKDMQGKVIVAIDFDEYSGTLYILADNGTDLYVSSDGYDDGINVDVY